MVRCSWSVPHTMPGVLVSWYEVNVTTSEGNQIVERTLTDTVASFNISQFGTYSVSVVAVIEPELTGETRTIQIEIPEGT